MKKDKPSATASLVLKAILFAAHDLAYDGLVHKDTVRWSKSIATKIIRFPGIFLFAIQNQFFRWGLKKIEEIFNPGFILHVAARKAFISNLAGKSIESGISQVIVFGAGYDTLGLRTASSYSKMFCFEVDHPSTQRMKRTAIAPDEVPANFFFVPADLSVTSISTVLSSHPRFDPQAKTLIVIEGVLMYLPADAVKNVFEQLTTLFTTNLTCIFTFMDRRSNGDIQFHTAHPLVNWWLRQKHERFLWGIERDQLPAYLKGLGFVETRTYGKPEFIETFFQASPAIPQLAEGELIAITKR